MNSRWKKLKEAVDVSGSLVRNQHFCADAHWQNLLQWPGVGISTASIFSVSLNDSGVPSRRYHSSRSVSCLVNFMCSVIQLDSVVCFYILNSGVALIAW